MHLRKFKPFLPLLALFAACGDDSGDENAPRFPASQAAQAIADYKKLVYANYTDTVTEAQQLKAAVDAFLAAPTVDSQRAAQEAWIAARVPYGPSEIFRFYEGPIDNSENGPEGEINAWPLDENYIDYTRDAPNGGLINDAVGTPEITAQVLKDANTAAGEEAISTGYHAIEFLLWGQDDPMPGTGPGQRPYTDYIEEGGTASNQARRKQYLSVVTDLLLSDLQEVTAQWDPSKTDNYQATFGVGGVEAQKTAISDLLVSLGSMANAELSGERMTVAYKNRSQEDEHSCFSDTTASDLYGNGLGIQNVWLGRYGSFDGFGLDELVQIADTQLARKTTDDIADAVAKLGALVTLQNTGKPIDVVITSAEGGPERNAMLDAIKALKVVGDDVEQAAKVLGLSVSLEKPSEEL